MEGMMSRKRAAVDLLSAVVVQVIAIAFLARILKNRHAATHI